MNNREIKFDKIEIMNKCPCGKEMIKDKETTGGFKCFDKNCWIIVDEKNQIWIGRQVL